MNFLDQIEGNKFKSGKRERFLFRSKGVDLEQLSPEDLSTFGAGLKNDLNLLKTGEIYKVYGLSTGLYIESSENNPPFRNLKLEASNEGLTPIIGKDNFYSDPDFRGGDFCKLNSEYIRFVTISPEENSIVDFGGLAKLGELFITFKKIDTRISKHIIDNSRKINHASLYKMLSDIEGIEAYKENEEVLWDIVNRKEELFKARIAFVVRGATEEELFDNTTELITQLSIRSYGPKVSTYYLNDDFLSFVPGLFGDLEDSLIVKSSLLLNCLPIHQDKIHNSGITFYSRSNKEVFIDCMKGDSYSALITAQTGKGKTFLAQKILSHEYEQGRAIFMIDPKADYEKFSLLNGFRIVDQNINPMLFKDDIYFRNIILSRIPESERTQAWSGKLLKAIRDTEAYKEDDFFKALRKLEKEGIPELELYFEDMKGRITTKKEDFTKYIYILSSSFTEDTLPFILTFAFEYLKRLGVPYKFLIDEAHRVFKTNPKFLEERVREVRVLKSGLIILTQSYNDLIKTDFGSIVADNCEHKFFSTQSINNSSGLKEHEIGLISGLEKREGQFSEFLYKSTHNSKVFRYWPTLNELEAFRSGEEEKKKLLSYVNDRLNYLTVEQAISSYVREVHGV